MFRELYETSKTAEVTKSKSMSLKSQLKSPFKFLGKTYCGGCKVEGPTIMQILASELSTEITWPRYWPLIGAE